MKWKSSVFNASLILLISNPVIANNFIIQNGSPTISYSTTLQNYVKTISHYQADTQALQDHLQKTIDYYHRVHILKTITKSNYIIDCIPFAEQPALLDNPTLAQSLLPSITQTTKNNFNALKKIGENFDFNAATECPLGSVAILRPTKQMLTSEIANKKVAPESSSNHDSLLAGGYTWEQGYTPTGTQIHIPTQATQAYFKGPQNQYVAPNNLSDHSLNQFWYLNYPENHHLNITYSVEFGIIASAYFTQPASTSIFVFASVDNYGSNSCYNLLCPNFIQAPGTTPIGVPITNKNADFVFQVNHASTPGLQPGYYLTLVMHNMASNKQSSANMLLGYYPDSLYAPANRPAIFSAGAEVYATAPHNGTLMYGNYANPYAGYTGPKQIGLYSENGNSFPYSTSSGPAPYGLIWNFGQ